MSVHMQHLQQTFIGEISSTNLKYNLEDRGTDAKFKVASKIVQDTVWFGEISWVLKWRLTVNSDDILAKGVGVF